MESEDRDALPEYAGELLARVNLAVPRASRRALIELLLRHPTAFSQAESDLGRTAAVRHRIETSDNRSFRQVLRRHPAALLESIDLSLDAPAGTSWFTTFDLRSGYHQVEMDPREADNTTFATRRGSLRFKVMPFGLCNAPATFQRVMNVALAGLDPEVCLMYLGDIIVHSVDSESHLVRLERLLTNLVASGLKLKVSKCQLLKERWRFCALGQCRRHLCRSNEGGCGCRLAVGVLPAGCVFHLGLVFLVPQFVKRSRRSPHLCTRSPERMLVSAGSKGVRSRLRL